MITPTVLDAVGVLLMLAGTAWAQHHADASPDSHYNRSRDTDE